VPNSVLCINFQTLEYDIKFGIYTAQIWSKFEVHNAETENQSIDYTLNGTTALAEIMPPKLIEYSQSAVKITYTAK